MQNLRLFQSLKMTAVIGALLVFSGCSSPPEPPEPSGEKQEININNHKATTEDKGHLVSDISEVSATQTEITVAPQTNDSEIEQRLNYRK